MFKIGGPYPLFLGKKDINSGNVEKREKSIHKNGMNIHFLVYEKLHRTRNRPEDFTSIGGREETLRVFKI